MRKNSSNFAFTVDRVTFYNVSSGLWLYMFLVTEERLDLCFPKGPLQRL